MGKKSPDYWESSRTPLHCLAFLAPLLIGYEIGAYLEGRTLLAEQMLRDLLTLHGRKYNFLSGLFVAAVLLGWQIVGDHPWKLRPTVVGWMPVEALALTLPLFALHALIPRGLAEPPKGAAPVAEAAPVVWAVPARPPAPAAPPASADEDEEDDEPDPAVPRIGAAPDRDRPGLIADDPVRLREEHRRRLLREVVISLGAGPYEELIFRFFLVELLIAALHRWVGTEHATAVVVAVLVSATLFAGYHHLPGTAERFTWGSFLFRTAAGVYFSMVFVARGYGIAAGCHTFYDILVDVARTV
jgi:membrane protease YdiL (CAAX protease family)